MIKDVAIKPIVKLVGVLESPDIKGLGPEELSVYGALSCFEEKTSLDLFLEDKGKLSEEDFANKKEKILRETSGRGHGSVLDQSRFAFVIEDIPRMVTLQLCLPEYLDHLQQSLRRAKADRGFYLPKAIIESRFFNEVNDLLNEGFALYEELMQKGIPGEDARNILSLFTRTNIQTVGDSRELMHLHSMSRHDYMPSIIRETVDDMVSKLTEVAPRLFKERGTNYEVLAWRPSSQLFAMKNKTLADLIGKYGNDYVSILSSSGIPITEEGIEKAVKGRDEAELANLKHVHYEFLAEMSLSCFHQATRQRTWHQSVEPIYNAAKRAHFRVAPSISKDSECLHKFMQFNIKSVSLYGNMAKANVPVQEAIGILPHALAVYDLIHVDGWNGIHSIGKRTCNEAQWEIRGIAKQMAHLIQQDNPVLGKYTQPQGITYGKCPERKPCGRCEKIKAE